VGSEVLLKARLSAKIRNTDEKEVSELGLIVRGLGKPRDHSSAVEVLHLRRRKPVERRRLENVCEHNSFHRAELRHQGALQGQGRHLTPPHSHPSSTLRHHVPPSDVIALSSKESILLGASIPHPLFLADHTSTPLVRLRATHPCADLKDLPWRIVVW